MKRFYPLLTAVLLAAGLPTVALAQQTPAATGSTSRPSGNTLPENMKGQHTMTGTISHIDHSHGTVSLKTEKGPLVLYFPPEEIKDYKEGDKMAVHLAIAKESEL